MNLENHKTASQKCVHSTRIIQTVEKLTYYLSQKGEDKKFLYDMYRLNRKSRVGFKVFVTILNAAVHNKVLSFVATSRNLVRMVNNDPNWTGKAKIKIQEKDVNRITNHLVECKFCTVEELEVHGKILKLMTFRDPWVLDQLSFLGLDPVQDRKDALKDVLGYEEEDMEKDEISDQESGNLEDSVDDIELDMSFDKVYEFDKNYKKGDK